MFIGGNGSSKSCSMANIIANLCWPGLNKWFEGTLYEEWPYDKTIRIISDPTTIEEKTIPEMEKWFPQGKYKKFKRRKLYYSYWETDTDWTIDLMTYEQDIKEFESVEKGLILFDEPPPERIFKASVSRLRLGGKLALFFTPLSEGAYLFDKYIDNPYQTGAEWIFVDVEDNCSTHGVRGFLEHENIQNMINNYDEDEKMARVHGKFMHLIGVIFPMFKKAEHVLEEFDELVKKWPKRTWKIAWAIDPHPVKQVAVSFMAIMKDGRKVIIGEIWDHLQIQDLAGRIIDHLIKYEEQGGVPMKVGLIDPMAVMEDSLRGGQSIISDLNRYFKTFGYMVKTASKDRDRGEDMVKQELRGTIHPNLYTTANCTHTIWEWRRYSKDPKNPEKRLKKADDMMENIYRLVLENQNPLFNKPNSSRRRVVGIGGNYEKFK